MGSCAESVIQTNDLEPLLAIPVHTLSRAIEWCFDAKGLVAGGKAQAMDDEKEFEFFKARKQAKTYISKVFKFNEQSTERIRQVRMVIEGSDRVHLGEIEGSMCLRLTGNTRKTQVTAYITQDEKKLKRLTLQTFKARSGDWIETIEKDEFTFRSDEFTRLLNFLS